MADEERVAALEARVRELESLLAALTSQVEAQHSVRDSMRGHVRCPACGGRRILRATKVADRDGGQQQPMAISTKGVFFPKVCGVFECDVCAACGLVEWHIADPSTIDLEHDNIGVISIDDESAGPYR